MSQRRFLAAVALGMFFSQSTSLMLAPLLVAMANEFDTSVAVAGQLATATFAAWGVGRVRGHRRANVRLLRQAAGSINWAFIAFHRGSGIRLRAKPRNFDGP
jgi:hypothetical protein